MLHVCAANIQQVPAAVLIWKNQRLGGVGVGVAVGGSGRGGGAEGVVMSPPGYLLLTPRL